MMQNSQWLEISVKVSLIYQPVITNFLFELGASGVEEHNDQVSGFFPAPVNVDEAILQIKEYILSLQTMGYPDIPVNDIVTVEEIMDRDWNAEWKKQFQPFLVSPAVMIKPTWCELPEDHPETVIELDPEMAFGTGTHATTALCAELLDKRVVDKTILDAGTGTGILAMIALKMGAKACYAFDVDPLATLTAKNNAAKNNISLLYLYTGTIKSVKPAKFDIIAANINSGQIMMIIDDFYNLLDANGVLILSGILDTERKKLTTALENSGFNIVSIRQRDEWLAFECIKPV